VKGGLCVGLVVCIVDYVKGGLCEKMVVCRVGCVCGFTD